jgi:nucleotide-binding universal stress UspA family protein
MAEPVYRERSVRRVVIALDESEGSQQALEEAARLAAALHVELVGLFVEDVSFLEAAALPVTRAFTVSARGPQEMAPDLMERAFRVHAGRIRTRLMETSTRWGLRASFRTARGIISETIEAQAEQGDLVAVGRSGGRTSNRLIVGSTAQALAERAHCSVLLFHGPVGAGAPVTALYEGSDRVLDLASEVASSYGRPLHVIVLGDGDVEKVGRNVEDWAAQHDLRPTVTVVDGSTDDKVVEAIAAETSAIAVIDAQGPVVQRVGVRNLLPHLGGPVLVARC